MTTILQNENKMKCDKCKHTPEYVAKFYEREDWLWSIFFILFAGTIGFLIGRTA